LKDWRRVATRYDRCAKTFLSAVALAATVIFWLWRSMSLDPNCSFDWDGCLSFSIGPCCRDCCENLKRSLAAHLQCIFRLF
jgi:hypothetical protein